MEGHQVKHLQIAGRRHQRTVKIVGHPVQVIHRTEIAAHGALHARFQGLVLGFKNGLGLGRKHSLMRKRQVQVHQAAHLFPQAQDVLVGNLLCAELAIIAAGQGVVDLEYLVREQVAGRPLSQEAQRTEHGAAAVGMVIANKFHLMGIIDRIVQRLQLVVYESHQHRVLLPGLGVRHNRRSNGPDGGSGIHFKLFSVVNAG